MGHALGRPKIDRVLIRIVRESNVALAATMAGELHLTNTQVLRFEQAMTLRQQAGFNDVERKGTLLFNPDSTRAVAFQFRPQYQQTSALLDLRVRQAIAHAIDREAVTERLFDSQSAVPSSFAYPHQRHYAEVESVVTKYPYDPRTTERLLAQVGYSKGPEGFLVGARGERLRIELWLPVDALHQTAATIVLDMWKQVGIDAEQRIVSTAATLDVETASTYSGSSLETSGGTNSIWGRHDGAQISSPANRWRGSNRSGWSNPDFDLLAERFNTTLDPAEQTRALVQAMKIHSELLPSIPLHYNFNVVTHVAGRDPCGRIEGPEGKHPLEHPRMGIDFLRQGSPQDEEPCLTRYIRGAGRTATSPSG